VEQNRRKDTRTLRANDKTLSQRLKKMKSKPKDLRTKLAKEAATLLYFGLEKEYKQAKRKAARTIGAHFLPTNLEVALELDRLANENEGLERKQRLTQMRQEAYTIMNTLKQYSPVLIGSVWRGTIRKGSDIDIELCHDIPEEVVKQLAANNLKFLTTEWVSVIKQGKTENTFHIYIETATQNKVEIVIRSLEETSRRRKCEVFGDEITGLTLKDLEQVLAKNPTAQFIPA
jgi:predicted nucleotidyltransferase